MSELLEDVRKMKKNKLRMITLERLLEMKENEEQFQLVEVLSPSEYQEWHIPDAINIPGDQIKEKASEHLDKNDIVVVYCASYTCHASTKAARALMELGYNNVLDFKAGKKIWHREGLERAGE